MLPWSSSGMPTPKSFTITVTYRVWLSLLESLLSLCGDCCTLDTLRWNAKRALLMVVWQPLIDVARVVRSWVGGDRAVLLTLMVTTLPDMLKRTALDRKFTRTSCSRLCADRKERGERRQERGEQREDEREGRIECRRRMTISRRKN
jgi:hypothetical protein